jgi:carboxymethylenebutenolidase
MRAGEDPGNTVPGNKTARDEGFARLVKLLREMKSAPAAGILPGKTGVQAAACHDAAPPKS